MRAYEFKITLKGSKKPPIWRKIVIPTGVTFAQLHNTIQIAMGWHNYHLHEFEFTQPNVRITNDEEACEEYKYFNSKEGRKRLKEMGASPFRKNLGQKALNSFEVKIYEYVEKSPTFTYVYDFGDWWEHKVELLNTIDDYKNDFPQVTKAKGICPPEDCGGIYGFHEFMLAWNDTENEQHEEMREWGEMQMFEDEYDLEYVNELLEDALNYEPENRDEDDE